MRLSWPGAPSALVGELAFTAIVVIAKVRLEALPALRDRS